MRTRKSTVELLPSNIQELETRLSDLESDVAHFRVSPPATIDAEALLENATDGFLVYDADFRFTYLNSDGERLLGRPKSELLGKTHWSIFPESRATTLGNQYTRAMTERVAATFEDRCLPLEAWFEVRVSPSTTGGLLVWLRDITARRQSEAQREGLLEAIQAERQVLNEIVEKSPVAIAILRAPGFVYELVNPAFQSLAPSEQILGRSFLDVWGESAANLLEDLKNVITSGLPFRVADSPRVIRRAPGAPQETIYLTTSWIPLVGPSGRPDRVLSLNAETTDRKIQEDRLRSSEGRLARAQKMANLGSWEQDLESGTFRLSNDACHILGIHVEESQTTLEALLSHVHPEDQALVRDTINNASAHGGCSQVDHRIILPDGEERTVRQYTEPMGLEDAGSGLLGTIQDVTEYKMLEEKFRRSQKLEGVARLAGGVAHDFNNLLVVINGYAQMIVSTLKSEDPLRVPAQEILNAGNRAATLTRQLLAFGRKQVIRPRPINLDVLISGVENMLSRLIREDIVMKHVSTPDIWSIKADPGQVEQVIVNLVVNARDAMPKKGLLTISTSNVELANSEIKGFLDLKPGRYVALSVTDTGTGMTAETKRRMFDPFFTTKPPGEGTGLGLSTVYGIVKQHGGDVTFYSELGLGTTFTIYWRATDQPAVPEAVPVGYSVSSYLGSETILLVEDDANVRELVRQMLLLQGYNVLENKNCSAAISLARDHDGVIDVLLTDVVMPQMDGQQLAGEILAIRPEIKVVFMSGYPGGIASKGGLFERGAFFLQKPFDMNSLGRILREVLEPGPPLPDRPA